ncbi:retinoid-inducible serine carboxypeptidase [Procambarus clarkii]|uniref:retinoid-inducible serine carboxypeptidase n=1 Tax=Procambarus clarkii TaxID=6728 RepID=UPI0037421F98
MNPTILFLVSVLIVTTLGTADGFSQRIKRGKETWGYVRVRDKAHMFFWLYYTTADVDYKLRPLVLWLQGGPGASSTGIGNFLEIGPQDASQQNRTNAWTEQVNVLFVDNPVGTGYSYVEDPKLLATNNTVIADDLVSFMKGFFIKVPEFENIPLYIFAESYGGKMAVKFAQSLNKAVQQKKIKCQLAGVALGDSWVSPVDAVLSWGPYLYATSLIDSAGLAKISKKTKEVSDAVQAGKMGQATELWGQAEDLIENVTNGVNFYNILKQAHKDNSSNAVTVLPSNEIASRIHECLYHRYVGQFSAVLDALMNGPIRDKLKVIPHNVTWGGQSQLVFRALAADFMNSAVKDVELLLNTSAIKVIVYNGQLDLIVNILGVQKWVENLHWVGTKQWVNAARIPMEDESGGTVAFTKSFKNFTFYWILNAGHMIPIDASDVALRMMKAVVGVK